MQFKPVPAPPASIETVYAVRAAVPRVPKPEADCCLRVCDRVEGIDDRETASDWLTFCRALRLVDEFDRGYGRTDDAADPEVLAARLRDRVVLADVVGTALEDGPATAEGVFDRVCDSVPEWERQRTDDWETVWQERVQRLLDWLVLFEWAAKSDDQYRQRDC